MPIKHLFKTTKLEVYEGSWKMSKRHGHGEQRYGVGTEDVSTFDGDWHKNCRHGRGTMTYASGNVYEGDWVEVSRCTHFPGSRTKTDTRSRMRSNGISTQLVRCRREDCYALK